MRSIACQLPTTMPGFTILKGVHNNINFVKVSPAQPDTQVSTN